MSRSIALRDSTDGSSWNSPENAGDPPIRSPAATVRLSLLPRLPDRTGDPTLGRQRKLLLGEVQGTLAIAELDERLCGAGPPREHGRGIDAAAVAEDALMKENSMTRTPRGMMSRRR